MTGKVTAERKIENLLNLLLSEDGDHPAYGINSLMPLCGGSRHPQRAISRDPHKESRQVS